MDPRRPLLAFLASALPENHPELSSLGDRLEEHVSGIVVTPETFLLGEHASLGMLLSNVPGAVNDVKARIVWVQVPTEHGVKLELVHRVCVYFSPPCSPVLSGPRVVRGRDEIQLVRDDRDDGEAASHYQCRRLVERFSDASVGGWTG